MGVFKKSSSRTKIYEDRRQLGSENLLRLIEIRPSACEQTFIQSILSGIYPLNEQFLYNMYKFCYRK